jgi:hypothetical protein
MGKAKFTYSEPNRVHNYPAIVLVAGPKAIVVNESIPHSLLVGAAKGQDYTSNYPQVPDAVSPGCLMFNDRYVSFDSFDSHYRKVP